MSSIVIKPHKVLEAVSDLTRHANWAVADISIIAEQKALQRRQHLFIR